MRGTAQIDSGGFVLLGFVVVIAVTSLVSFGSLALDSWRRFARNREFHSLLEATLNDLARSESATHSYRAAESVVEGQPLIDPVTVRVLLGEPVVTKVQPEPIGDDPAG